MPTLYVPHNDDIYAIHRLFRSINHKSHNSMPLDPSHPPLVSSRLDDLPSEIIQQIFLECLPNEYNPIMSLEHAPLLLTQVSANWRKLAVHTPLLWNSIHISSLISSLEGLLSIEEDHSADPTEEDATVEYLEVIDDWLGMSSTHPLNISYIDLGMNTLPGSTRILSEVVHKYSSRIEKLDITVNEPALRSLEDIRPDDLSLLRALRIKFPSNTEQPCSCSGLLQAPQLRSLDLRKVSVPVTDLAVAWSRLTHLSLREEQQTLSPVHIALADLGTVLRSARHLVSCEVEIYSTLEEDSVRNMTTEPISLPHLRRLAVHEHDGDLESFFSFLDAPHLDDLEFYTDASAIHRPPPTVLPFLERYGGKLQRFATNLVRFSKEDFIQALRGCPHLTTLSIKSFDIVDGEFHRSSFMMASVVVYQKRLPLDDQFLRFFMTPNTSGNYLVPELNRMEFLDGFKFSRDTAAEFINFKETTAAGVQKKSFTLRLGAEPEGRLDLDLDVGGISSEDLQAKLESLYIS